MRLQAIREEDDKNDTNRDNDSNEKQINESKRTRRKTSSTCENQKTSDLNYDTGKGEFLRNVLNKSLGIIIDAVENRWYQSIAVNI